MTLIEKILKELISTKIIPEKGSFEITEDMINNYYLTYKSLKSKNGKMTNSNIKLAKKLAGLNLMKLSIERGNHKETVIKSIKPKCGMIYIISNPAYPNKFKIGITQNIQKRLSQYQTGDPFRKYKLDHYKFVLDMRNEEARYIEKFKLNIVNGEWIDTDKIKEVFLSENF